MKKRGGRPDLRTVLDAHKSREEVLLGIKRQIRTAAKAAGIFVVVVWLLALGFGTGLKSIIPYIVAGVLTLALAIVAALVWRNLEKSKELGELIDSGAEVDAVERERRLAQLEAKAGKGDAVALLGKAQLQMQSSPRQALETLETINLDKAQRLIATQVRSMRAMIHLNLGEVRAARELADVIDLKSIPDPKLRANFAGFVAEAWARTGNPIEAKELLDKYELNDETLGEARIQLLRASVFASAHLNKVHVMKSGLNSLEKISPELIALFLSQKTVHPLLQQEAKRRLEKSGLMPRQRIQSVRR